MTSMELSIYDGKVNVDIENSTVIVTGFDLSELLKQFTVKDVLDELEYSDVMDYVTEAEKDKAELRAEEQNGQ